MCSTCRAATARCRSAPAISATIRMPFGPSRLRSRTRSAGGTAIRGRELLDQPVLEGPDLGTVGRGGRADEPPGFAAVDDLREGLKQALAVGQLLAEELRRADGDAGALHRRLDGDH